MIEYNFHINTHESQKQKRVSDALKKYFFDDIASTTPPFTFDKMDNEYQLLLKKLEAQDNKSLKNFCDGKKVGFLCVDTD